MVLLQAVSFISYVKLLKHYMYIFFKFKNDMVQVHSYFLIAAFHEKLFLKFNTTIKYIKTLNYTNTDCYKGRIQINKK